MIRRAEINDIDKILSIVRNAQLSLRELGIDQWQDGYPNRSTIIQDIERGVGYVVINNDNAVIGYGAIVLSGEEAYKQIPDAQWSKVGDYVVVHRICVDREARRRGVAIEIMSYAATMARNAGYEIFRIDTHKGNIRMLSMLKKLEFKSIGTVRYDSGERTAFDLDLTSSKTL